MTPDSRPLSATATLAALRQQYQVTSAGICDRIADCAAGVARAPHELAPLEALRRELHRLRGTAGTFGFVEVSRIAGAFEQRVGEWLDDPHGSDAANRSAEALGQVRELRRAFGHDAIPSPRA